MLFSLEWWTLPGLFIFPTSVSFHPVHLMDLSCHFYLCHIINAQFTWLFQKWLRQINRTITNSLSIYLIIFTRNVSFSIDFCLQGAKFCKWCCWSSLSRVHIHFLSALSSWSCSFSVTSSIFQPCFRWTSLEDAKKMKNGRFGKVQGAYNLISYWIDFCISSPSLGKSPSICCVGGSVTKLGCFCSLLLCLLVSLSIIVWYASYAFGFTATDFWCEWSEKWSDV